MFRCGKSELRMTGLESKNVEAGAKGGFNNFGGKEIGKEMSAGRGGGGGGGRHPVALTELAKNMADFAADREWDRFHSPRNLLLALVCFRFSFPWILLESWNVSNLAISTYCQDVEFHWIMLPKGKEIWWFRAFCLYNTCSSCKYILVCLETSRRRTKW